MHTKIRLLIIVLALLVVASLPALAHHKSGACAPNTPVSSVPGVPLVVAPSTLVTVNLLPYLQAEVNEVAMLTAQSNCLRQQGDMLGANLFASYIPDHRMQVRRILRVIGTPISAASLQPNMQPFLGTREAMIEQDRDAHSQAIGLYQTLFQQSVGNFPLHDVALLGLKGAYNHFDSLTIADASIAPTPDKTRAALFDALSLERGAVGDLNSQAMRLQDLGDLRGANLLLSQVPAHLQQIVSLENAIVQIGGDPAFAVPPLSIPPATRFGIFASQRVKDFQLASTYAVPAQLASSGPLHEIALTGQQIARNGLSLTSPIV